ncbi:MAG: hypothetical protein EXS13_10470 [Planctomycetes bacterium]|nr:hypothetical protein [Planctomycetota bacterium]
MSLSSELQLRIAALQRALEPMDYACSGSLFTRTRLCGKSNCHCATDPDARHGPYFTWAHRDRDRIVHHILTREQAQVVRRAILHQRTLRKLLAQWDRESTVAILAMRESNS